ncbi:MAG TPA: hypothetical protein VM100_11030, partial [Longimicrobiales bacterium]|nr:hypothetical protein [Longimicrobiales bacterium]
NARWKTAMSYFSRAVAEDTTFALASYRLAVAADWASQFDTARSAVDRALRHGQRLSGHDRELLVAFNSALRGRADEAEAAYKHITSDYPDDVEAWYRYGEVLYHYNPVRGRSVFESKPMFERAVQAAPDVEPMVLHLMELALYKRDWDNFDRLAKRVDATKPASLRRIMVRDYTTADAAQRAELEAKLTSAKDGDVFVIATGLAQFSRDLPAAERVARILTLPTRPLYVRAAGLLAIAQYQAARLNWSAARATLAQLASINEAYALEHEALWASMPFLEVPKQELQAIRARVQKWNAAAADSVHQPNVYLGAHNGVHPLLRFYLLGVMDARLGDYASAERQASALSVVSDSVRASFAHRLATAVRAHADFARKDYTGVLERLDNTRVDADLDLVYNSVFWNGAVERFVRAEALRALNRSAEADPWYASLMEGRNEVFFYPVTLDRLVADFRTDDAKGSNAAVQHFVALHYVQRQRR